MANNKVSSLLNVDFPKPKTSNFNLGRVNRFTADVGWVIPCYVEEVLPNSYKRLDVESLITTNATVAPLMGSFKATVDCFFVPLRLYYRHLSLNNRTPGFSDDFDFHHYELPVISHGDNNLSHVRNSVVIETTQMVESNIGINRANAITYAPLGTYHYYLYGGDTSNDYKTIGVGPSTLIDYLGMLPVGFSPLQFYQSITNRNPIKMNGNPFIAYFDIWRNYYSNPHDVNVPMRVRNYINDRDFDEQFNSAQDVYIPLENFDKFVDYISTNSLDSSLNNSTPVSLNVIDVYNRFIRYTANTTGDTQSGLEINAAYTHAPLFSNEVVFVNESAPGGEDGQLFEIYDTSNSLHFGLLPRTYMDDYFNSRFRNDFVTYMEESSRVKVENNTFTISQLRMQNRIAKYVDKSIFSDTRFGSWLKAHFGVKTNHKLDIPQFLGSISTNLIFNDIYSTAQTGDGGVTSNQALGSRSSLGQGYIKNKGSFVEFKATEPGFIMCMFSIRPYVSYFQGIKKMYLKSSFNDIYKPEYDAVGYDDLQKAEFTMVPYSTSNPLSRRPMNFSAYNTSLGKVPSWFEYMTSFDEAHGLMTQRFEYGYWLLNRPFSPHTYDGDDSNLSEQFDFSTYIRPEYFNTIFAVDKYYDNFQVQMRFFDKTKQPISKQILPHL